MAKVELKKPIVEEISANIADAQGVVLVNYSGLTVAQDTQLRKELREAGVVYKVYKNTMMNFAFQGTPCEELCKHLDGTNALAISKEDATAPARILAKFAKTAPQLELVAGVVEGGYYDQAGIKALSEVPSREELLGKLLGSIPVSYTHLGADGIQSKELFIELAGKMGGVVLPMLFVGPDRVFDDRGELFYGMDINTSGALKSYPAQRLTGSAYWLDTELFKKLLMSIVEQLSRTGVKDVYKRQT